MHALLTRCRRSNLTQFDIKGRMFDVLVEPVLSYASHIWGPMAFKKHLLRNPYGTKAEKVQTSYLRIMTGVGKGAALDVVYRDLHRLPVVYHWVALAVRWWNRMQLAHAGTSQCMASYAWVEDVKLALEGSKVCWSFHVLSAMVDLRLLQPDWRRQPLEWVLARRWEEPAVKLAVAGVFKARWHVDGMVDPRQAPSRGVSMCTHHMWVYPLDPGIQDFSRGNAPQYTKLCLPFGVLRVLAQLRIGWAHLEVEQGRKRRPKVPREARLCRLCSGDDAALAMRQAVLARTGSSARVEDLKHFLLECPVYDDIRAACAAFPTPVVDWLDNPDCMAMIFSHEAQSSLAHTLYKMKARRARLLGLTNGI
jgi:hypothetical protein